MNRLLNLISIELANKAHKMRDLCSSYEFSDEVCWHPRDAISVVQSINHGRIVFIGAQLFERNDSDPDRDDIIRHTPWIVEIERSADDTLDIYRKRGSKRILDFLAPYSECSKHSLYVVLWWAEWLIE